MKQFLPALLLFFIGSVGVHAQATAQNKPVTKTQKDADEDWDKTFVRIANDGEFPGGDSAWNKFVAKKLVYPKNALEKKIEGTVTVKFIIGKDGTVSDAEVMSGPEELRKNAIDVVMRSPKWHPAIQCGRQVRAYKKRDVVFKLPAQL